MIYHVSCLIVSFISMLSFVISFPTQLVFPAVCLPVAGIHAFFTEFYSSVCHHRILRVYPSLAEHVGPDCRALFSLPRTQASLPCSVTLDLDP